MVPGMRLTGFQKLAVAALVALIVLIFMGAIVRATGAGMGCPDWPRCWGKLIPPTAVEDVDFSKLDLEKFRRKAARYDRDPASITVESMRAEFNPVHVWTEFINRLTSLPVGLLTLGLFIASFWQRPERPAVFWAAFGSIVLVMVNAWMGAKVVESGLHPGTITLHMALAILLMCLLVFTAWRGRADPWRIEFAGGGGWLGKLGLALFVLVVFEGVMGSQVRELTDQLAHSHPGEMRAAWVGELETTWVYLIHRSFSWLILATAIGFFAGARKFRRGGTSWVEKLILSLVLAQMVLGVVLANVGIHPLTQVLHIGLSSILVSTLFLWLLGCFRRR
jgi:cytochrome c oxidase assembly protein subunit 15